MLLRERRHTHTESTRPPYQAYEFPGVRKALRMRQPFPVGITGRITPQSQYVPYPGVRVFADDLAQFLDGVSDRGQVCDRPQSRLRSDAPGDLQRAIAGGTPAP